MKTVLITGAGGGLGSALVRVFFQEGWEVYGVVRKAAPHLAGLQRIEADLSTDKGLSEVVRAAPESLDVLINCAGLYDTQGDSVDDDLLLTTLAEITPVFQVNTMAPILLAERVRANLERGECKLVLTTTSIMGTHALMDEYHAEHWPYSASKAAVNYAMIGFAKRFPNLTSTLIHPGWVRTKMGGKNATVEPTVAAQKIFTLVMAEHLPSGVLLDTDGKEMRL